jgi:hypothetical protein
MLFIYNSILFSNENLSLLLYLFPFSFLLQRKTQRKYKKTVNIQTAK